nr:LuxR family transcriptional regulator [Streptomyces boncukensis]
MAERAHTVGRLAVWLDSANRGTPFTGMISGPVGMGKTLLLHKLEEHAAANGFAVLGASCQRTEQDRPYAALHRLLDGAGLFRAPAEEARDATRRALQAIGQRAGGRSVLLGIDDLQYADPQSLRCLYHLAHQVTSVPLAVVWTWDQTGEGRAAPLLEELTSRPATHRLRLGPISVPDVAELMDDRSGPRDGGDSADSGDACDDGERGCAGGDSAADAYHALSGGNPLLVAALLRGGDGPGFRRAALACVRRAGQSAVRVARSVAVLREHATVHRLSRLSGSSIPAVRDAVRKLTAAGVLEWSDRPEEAEGPRFRHPAAADAVLQDAGQRNRTRLRHDAARLLHLEGSPTTAIADQLLAAGPLREDWVPSALQDAAARALTADQVSLSLRYLHLMRASCPDGPARHTATARIAAVNWLRSPGDPGPTRAAKSPVLRDEVAPDAGWAMAELLLWHLRFTDAEEVVRHLRAREREGHAPDPGAHSARSEALQLLAAVSYPGVAARFGPSAGLGSRWPEATALATHPPMLRARLALARVLSGQTDGHTVAQAEQVLQDGGFSHASLGNLTPALLSLVYADQLDSAVLWCDRFLNGPSSHDLPAWRSLIGSISALVSFRQGHLDRAREEAEKSLGCLAGESPDWNSGSALTLATLAEVHTAVGDRDRAAELFSRPVPAALFATRPGLHYLHARGRLHLASGRARAALNDFLACGERMAAWDMDTPSLVPWRTAAAEAWLELGERGQARKVLETNAALGDARLPRAQGLGLRGLAAASDVQERLPVLEKALHALQQSGDRYQAAETLADLSETYQALGDKAKARTAARRARRIAESCRADRLCSTLVSTAVPPLAASEPNGALGGAESGSGTGSGTGTGAADDKFARLSESERRVAVLAAQGYTNREISEKLHVTLSTVEQHLTRVYRKMRIRKRDELPTEFRIDVPQGC